MNNFYCREKHCFLWCHNVLWFQKPNFSILWLLHSFLLVFLSIQGTFFVTVLWKFDKVKNFWLFFYFGAKDEHRTTNQPELSCPSWKNSNWSTKVASRSLWWWHDVKNSSFWGEQKVQRGKRGGGRWSKKWEAIHKQNWWKRWACETKGLEHFNHFACFWPKGYQLGSLGKSHQNGDYLKQAIWKIVFPQESNLQPLDYRSTALPLELEKTPPRMLNFGYLNPATCLLYDCNNKSIKMFFWRLQARVLIF